MSTLFSILAAALVIILAIGGLASLFVFSLDNQGYKDFIKKFTH
ncbi:hypothetical protein [Pseudobacteriovorax antillogorgiicola]|uniref:Uncharacterized protein n=1 Tax=Pseudobacteriovorax antillogorgiicola TaxID=1513793 RepID=A0A1Y6CPM6_9BACT|nr:hypothetical protein [Pseudobacteriovorax antillogorgiicola]TCS42868.1 hypothetical protein EDD56_13812 [Pseudobacteriovorax antillogorgiicola]SMF82048.1 hypothetical protein SAMN06296036_13912 [Pseudobacteriovorax antillogorgiicola]